MPEDAFIGFKIVCFLCELKLQQNDLKIQKIITEKASRVMGMTFFI